MDRAEATGLGVAVLGHALLFAVLTLTWLAQSKPLPLTDPVEVQLVDDVGLRSAQPKVAAEEPAPSVAPEIAPPEPVAAPTPQPPLPQPKAKATPPPPAPSPVAKPKPSHLATDLALATTAATVTAKAKPKGARLGANFLDGISDKPSASTSKTPKAATIDAKAMAGLADAIRRQVQPCADRITNPGPGASDIRTKLHLVMTKDGRFASTPEMMAQTGVTDDNQRYAQRVKELAIGAFTQCAPFHLPAELYQGGWNNIIMNYKLP